jgi:NAD(P)-dependent dehydrogenase (short-subunit alcohol dehydrogenase family)
MLVKKLLPADLYANKTVFVTGGGSGINFGVAKNFAALGAKIGLCGRTQEKLDQARTELEAMGAKVFTQTADVRDYGALSQAFEACEAALGPMHVLVAGAAGNFPAPAEGISANGFKTVIDIDLLGAFNSTRAAFEQLSKTKGSVIFISAGQAYMPYPYQAHVGAAKAGIDMMMKNIAMEWGRLGIRLNSIVPGPIAGTEGMKRLGSEQMTKQLERVVPLQRYGTTDDIGQAAVFLGSELASYITGSVMVVDGGMNLPGSGLWASMIASDVMKAQSERKK